MENELSQQTLENEEGAESRKVEITNEWGVTYMTSQDCDGVTNQNADWPREPQGPGCASSICQGSGKPTTTAGQNILSPAHLRWGSSW